MYDDQTLVLKLVEKFEISRLYRYEIITEESISLITFSQT